MSDDVHICMRACICIFVFTNLEKVKHARGCSMLAIIVIVLQDVAVFGHDAVRNHVVCGPRNLSVGFELFEDTFDLFCCCDTSNVGLRQVRGDMHYNTSTNLECRLSVCERLTVMNHDVIISVYFKFRLLRSDNDLADIRIRIKT